MKSLKNISLSALLTLTMLSSCEKLKDFGDTNVNPNGTTVPTTAALLTNVLSGIGNRASQVNPGYYCQYFAETQYPTVSLYSNPQFDFDGLYAGPLYDLQNIIKHNENPETAPAAALSGNPKNQIAIARVLKCYYFWNITDAWGDCPYSEALNADPFTLTFTQRFPKYDSQESVYKALIAELTTVVDLFEDGGDAIKGDIVFNGSVAKWKKFANSLRVLMALRLSKKYPGAGEYAAEQMQAAIAHPAGIITSNADNFTVNYPGGSFKNPWFGAYASRNDYGQSKYFVDLLVGMSDPRQTTGVYGSSLNGVPYGRDRQSFMNVWFQNNSTTYSKIMFASFRAETSPVNVLHAATVLFALAEAAERGWINTGVTAEDYYKNAIASSFYMWGLSTSAVGTYLANPFVSYAGANPLNKIALQRYIALYPDGLQGWCEWRRTGIPALTPAQDAINVTKQIPRRYVYGVNDYSTNRNNVLAASALIPLPVPTPSGASAGDTQDGKVWWDR